VNVSFEFSEQQLGEIAAAVVAEMERQGKVMQQPKRLAPFTLLEAVEELRVSKNMLLKWCEAGRLHRVPGTAKIIFTADSVSKVQKGEA